MPCYRPLTGYYSKDVGASGKRGITFDRNASLSGIGIKLPCGQCIGCRLEYSRQWAMRCVHEKYFHESSEFVTLTYSDENLPEGGTLVKRDLQLFNKRVRKRLGRFRFYACGEYGGRYGRPHYHSIMFGLELLDKKFFKRNSRGETVYTSKVLEEIWGHGFVTVGDVSFHSCAYVARYIVDKVTGDDSERHYRVIDGNTGVVVDRLPEFNLMSRRPGIGCDYYDKYGNEVYCHDSVIVNGQEVRPPRYYDAKFEQWDAERLAKLKLKRRRKAILGKKDLTVDRLRVREIVARRKLELKQRSV